MKAMVQFAVGITHPLNNKFVLANVEFGKGYDGRQIHGVTVNPVHYPEDPEGLWKTDSNGNFLGFCTRPAYDEIYNGWISKILLPGGHVISAQDYAEYQEYLRLKAKFERC